MLYVLCRGAAAAAEVSVLLSCDCRATEFARDQCRGLPTGILAHAGGATVNPYLAAWVVQDRSGTHLPLTQLGGLRHSHDRTPSPT